MQNIEQLRNRELFARPTNWGRITLAARSQVQLTWYEECDWEAALTATGGLASIACQSLACQPRIYREILRTKRPHPPASPIPRKSQISPARGGPGLQDTAGRLAGILFKQLLHPPLLRDRRLAAGERKNGEVFPLRQGAAENNS